MTSVTPLRHAAGALTRAAGSMREALDHRLPVLFNRNAVFARRAEHLQAGARQASEAVELLRAAGPRGDELASTIQRDVEYLQRCLGPRGRGFQAARHSLANQSIPERFDLRADRAKLLADLAGMDDDAARATLEARLEPVLHRWVAGDDAARRELALIAGLPDHVRPRHLQTRIVPGVWDVIGTTPDTGFSLTRHDALDEVRAAIRRYELERMPAEQLDARIDELLARDPDSLDYEQVRELATAATLPTRTPRAFDLSIVAHPSRMFAKANTIASASARSLPNSYTDSFLREVEALRHVRDGLITSRRQALEEMASILDTPSRRLTRQQERQIAVLVRLPEELRPPLPTRPDVAFRFQKVGVRHSSSPMVETGADYADRMRVLDGARDHFHDLRDPGKALAELRAAVEADELFDVHRMAALLADPDTVRAAGIDDPGIARMVTRQLLLAGNRDVRGAAVQRMLETTRERLGAMALPEQFDDVRRETIELLDRNLDRIAGVRTDTFGRHPDYAEVGRIAANVQLIEHASGMPARTPASSSAAATELLAW